MTKRISMAALRIVVVLIVCLVGSAGTVAGLALARQQGPHRAATPAPSRQQGPHRAATPAPSRRESPPAAMARAMVGGPELASTGVAAGRPVAGAGRITPPPAIPAASYIVADAGTGQVLAAKDPHGWFQPASTLKVLTAISLLPKLNPDATALTSRQAASVSPNVVGLVRGRRYKVSDLFRAMLLISANDAAMALAQATGSVAAALDMMNAEARHLQAYDVEAKNPDGLTAPGQHVSAYDLALIGRQALAMPAFMRYDSALNARFPVTARKSVPLANQNELLTSYPGALGGKIGWTIAAGATYIGMARRNGVTLIVAVLHCPALTETSYGARLLTWGFSADGKVQPVGHLVSPAPPGPAAPAPAPAVRPSSPAVTAEAKGIPSGMAAASGALAMFLVTAAMVLVLLRRRSPRRPCPRHRGPAARPAAGRGSGTR